jgi:hypothetical protein
MGMALEKACQCLALIHRNDPLTDILAEKIIILASSGDHDPDRLCNLVLEEFGGSSQ